MKHQRARLAISLAIAVPLAIILSTGCSPRMSYYNGGDTEIQPSEQYVRLTINNRRTNDALAPHIILIGNGRHELGIVQGMGGKLSKLVDTRWFGASGCFRVIAHYVGTGDLIFDEVCWRPGEVVTASLDDIFIPAALWSHR